MLDSCVVDSRELSVVCAFKLGDMREVRKHIRLTGVVSVAASDWSALRVGCSELVA